MASDVPDALACQQVCKKDAACKFFTFVMIDADAPGRYPAGSCFLKTSDRGRTPLGGYISGGIDCPKEEKGRRPRNADRKESAFSRKICYSRYRFQRGKK